MKKAAIIGGTGYGAIELIRLLQSHKEIEITKIISQSQAGEELSATYPHLNGIITKEMEALNTEELEKEIDILFLAAPAGVAKNIIPSFRILPFNVSIYLATSGLLQRNIRNGMEKSLLLQMCWRKQYLDSVIFLQRKSNQRRLFLTRAVSRLLLYPH